MSDFKEKFSAYSSEHLLQMRARGLSDEANMAIEEIFAERGERLPARPKAPIEMPSLTSRSNKTYKSVLLGVIGLIGLGVANSKEFQHSWIGILIAVAVVSYFAFSWLRRQTLTPAKKEEEDDEKKAREEQLTEIMVCAAKGDMERIRELVDYGGDVNARSLSGTTALMYAARNNQLQIVKFLLAAGADSSLISEKKSRAIDIAKKFGYHEIVAALEQCGKLDA